MDYLFTSESIISFFILVVLEIVLGIDNVIFVSIIMNRLPQKDEKKARTFWMITGMIVRSLLLMGLGWLLAQKDMIVIPKTSHPKRLRELLAAADRPLTEAELAELDELFPPPSGPSALEML